MNPLVDLIAGARPNFMKIAPIVAALTAVAQKGGRLRYRLVHTGQHYDYALSGAFFEELGLPKPQVNLEAGSGTAAEQTAAIMQGYEKLVRQQPPTACVVVGDVNSTMACAIVARKAGIPVAHVEGGIRSGDWSMPEEINRVVTDAITNWFFTTSETANENLRRAGVDSDRIFFVGNTMIDTLLTQRPRFTPPLFWEEYDLRPGDYFVLTLHRPANVDLPTSLHRLLLAVGAGTRGHPVVFPVHPRTSKVLTAPGAEGLPANLRVVAPQTYLQFNYLVQHARAVITDSGGITEETTVLGVPCLTLRDNTERPETVALGTNELIGTDPTRLQPALDRLFAGEWKRGTIPPLWDGHAGERIVAILERLLAASTQPTPVANMNSTIGANQSLPV
ncbi:MAG: UDP-N-acetylglucosamine 2-epimerase (non-hydrolyzing) [Verrucomicrobia bacterium]|jgi:UDP-N-acetylglucosamine 2-epimerase (non-hydrolysing)|nr:UDP-N-acetylglucosamine 2-epimerase (non-hydrolyzing) [Verrucomicrobiota bacterium]